MIIGTRKYADLRDINDATVRKAIIHGWSLPGVIGTQKVGKTHLLTIDIESFAKYLKISSRKLKKDLESNAR